LFPGRKRARLHAVDFGFLGVVNVVARAAGAGLGILAEHLLEFIEQVRLGAEMAEVVVAPYRCFGDCLLHRGAVITVEGVALYKSGLDPLAPEDLLKGVSDRGGSGPRGAGHRNDGMLDGHGRTSSSGTKQAAVAEQGRPLAELMPSRHVAADELDLRARSKDQRRPLVEGHAGDLENRALAVDRLAARLLDEQRDGIGLVEEPQPPLLVALASVGGI